MLRQFLHELETGTLPDSYMKRDSIVWRQVETFEEAAGKKIEDGYTRQEYLALFSSMNLRSSGYFSTRRSAVSAYIKYLVAKGILTPEHVTTIIGITFSELGRPKNDNAKTLYHYSLGDLECAIRASLDASESYDKTLFDPAVCALYLAWFGFDRKEIPKILKSDVQENGVLHAGSLMELPDSVCKTIQRYCQAEGYEQQARGIVLQKYKPSVYLFRTTRAATMDDKQLRATVNRLNTLLDGRYSLEYDLVRKSGVLSRMQAQEQDGKLRALADLKDDLQLAAAVFESPVKTKQQASALLEDYEIFKKTQSV